MMHYQQQDKSQNKTSEEFDNYLIKHFHGVDKEYSLMCRKKIEL